MYRSIVILTVILACLWQSGLSNETPKPQQDVIIDNGTASGDGGDGGATFEDDEDLAEMLSGSGSGSGSGFIPADNSDDAVLTTPTKTASTIAVTSTTTSPMPKTECQKLRETSRRLSGSKHLPKCDSRGDFESLQCLEDQCWCSDLEGVPIPGTHMEAPNRPDCSQGLNMPPCLYQLVQFARSGRLGAFQPSCNVEGQFDRIQCHGSMCYCVDEETGVKVQGSERHIPATPSCDDDSFPYDKFSPGSHEDKDFEEDKEKEWPEKEDKEPEIVFPTLDEDKDTINLEGGDTAGSEDDQRNTDIHIGGGTRKTTKTKTKTKVKPGVPDRKDKGDRKGGRQDAEDNRTGWGSEGKLGETGEKRSRVADSQILTQPGLLGGIIGGSVVLLLGLVLLVMFIVYRMRKKDEGSYPLDEPCKVPNYSYVRAPEREYYA